MGIRTEDNYKKEKQYVSNATTKNRSTKENLNTWGSATTKTKTSKLISRPSKSRKNDYKYISKAPQNNHQNKIQPTERKTPTHGDQSQLKQKHQIKRKTQKVNKDGSKEKRPKRQTYSLL